jgi:hypothetical protein
VVTWERFQELFRAHHIPDSLMERKREEFINLKQGSSSVLAYSKEFMELSRYAGDEISTDAKMQRRFRGGLQPTLKFQISLLSCNNFEELVNLAIKAESGSQEFERSFKHSRDAGSSSSGGLSQKKHRVWVQDASHRPSGFVSRPPTPSVVSRGAQSQQGQFPRQQQF